MVEEWKLEDAKVLVYLSEKSGDFSDILKKASNALTAWQKDRSSDAKQVLLYWMQNSSSVANSIISQLTYELQHQIKLEVNLELLEGCSMPRVSQPDLLDELWNILGSSESVELVHQIAHIICLLLPSFSSSLASNKWWPAIVSTLTKTENRKQISAGLKTWLACISTGSKSNDVAVQNEITNLISSNSEQYFELLEKQVYLANKIALQILELSLNLTNAPIDNDIMKFDPHTPGVRDAWARYISLIEVLAIDASVHQTSDSLPDFAALLSSNSPIPPRWIIALINVGMCQSNTEGIRVLIMQLIMCLQQTQLSALAKFPHYVARTLYPKFMQTPNFVVLSNRCLQAEHLQGFTKNMLNALIEEGLPTLREFVYEFAQFLLEHAHCFEAPRVLVANVMLNTLPKGALTQRETVPLLAAARATVLTYNSKAMADLYYSLFEKVVLKSGPDDRHSLKNSNKIDDTIVEVASGEWGDEGPLTRPTLYQLKTNLAKYPKFQLNLPTTKEGTPKSLFDIHSQLQLWFLYGNQQLNQQLVADLLKKELKTPRAMNANDRKRLSTTIELAFDYLDSTTYEVCEETFAAFNEIDTRLAALRCYRRSKPKNIPLEDVQTLWNHIKDATLRIIDRDFHLTFIDLLTEPGFVDPETPPLDICIEIVGLSVLKRNLLVPLARGLARFKNQPVPTWVMLVMARVFAFVKSPEYTVRVEEIVAIEFDVYEKYWGEPESRARAIAAVFLHTNGNQANKEACDATVLDTLEQADLEKRITGSLDNLEAHRRVLYYQILILLQRGCSKDIALDVLTKVRASLESEANPPVRMQGEWLIGVIITCKASNSKEFSDFVVESIKNLTLEVGVPPRVLGSLIRISMLLYFSSVKRASTDKETSEQIGESLVLHLLPLATSNKAVVRHRAISALYILDRNNLTPTKFKEMVTSIAKVNEGGVKNSSYANESYLWDVLDTRLGPVCGGICSTVFDRYMPNTLLESDFQGFPHEIVGPCWSADNIVKENRHGDKTFPDVVEYREKIVHEAVKNGMIDDFSRQIQTKSGTFDGEYQARRTPLVVVATLCDKPVNLGAITRLSDALGASKLIMRDKNIIEDPQYKSTALTAEKWIPIGQVTENDLAVYLLQMKAEGYTLVGIEQTDTSKKLSPKLQFPEKTLLMMGHERQGIPAEILCILDACVEIEQLGYVRSMNIQTATAVVVHAYNLNHSPGVYMVGYEDA